MAIFDELSKKITSAGQSVVKGTKDFADVTRLNSLISDEQKVIEDAYGKLGAMLYERFGERLAELGTEGEQFREMCSVINDSFTRISQYQNEVQQIKGIRICTNCNAEIPAGSAFCSSCGTPAEKAPAPSESDTGKRFCMSCGAQVEAGAAFCTACGQKME